MEKKPTILAKNSEDIAERRNLNEFNVISTEWGISLSSTRIDEKSNEILKMQKVMKQLDCRGCVMTADAMNTQKATAKAIIEEAHGDYCLALKENLRNKGNFDIPLEVDLIMNHISLCIRGARDGDIILSDRTPVNSKYLLLLCEITLLTG